MPLRVRSDQIRIAAVGLVGLSVIAALLIVGRRGWLQTAMPRSAGRAVARAHDAQSTDETRASAGARRAGQGTIDDERVVWLPAPRDGPTGAAAGGRVREYGIECVEVTQRRFSEFVRETGYQTTAEQQGTGRVFDPAQHTWNDVPGADWRRPLGPQANWVPCDDDPVTQVSWRDAQAFCRWTGGRLPTSAQWQAAARGELYDAPYPWGIEVMPGGRYAANSWQGWFPDRDLGLDGFTGPAPVGSFPPNRFGLFDVAGNVWEWLADDADESSGSVASAGAAARAARFEPEPAAPREKRLAGGSFLSAENTGWLEGLARHERAAVSFRANHIGFRVAYDARSEH